MKASSYNAIEQYMLGCMNDSAHDKEHIYRVLYIALDIASYENEPDMDILIASCLLHDIGREKQYQNPDVCHAKAGSQMAYDFLLEHGWTCEQAGHVRDCVLTHRFRSDLPPQSTEARILFDSDKIDAAGTLGIARTILYKGQMSQPLYSVDADGNVLDGTQDELPSLFHEYKFKLEKVYDLLYTKRGMEIAEERRQNAMLFYNNLLAEVQACYTTGLGALQKNLEK